MLGACRCSASAANTCAAPQVRTVFSEREQVSPKAAARAEAAQAQGDDADAEQAPEPAEELCSKVAAILREVATEQSDIIQGICTCASQGQPLQGCSG